MRKMIVGSLGFLLAALTVAESQGSSLEGPELSVVVDGATLPKYSAGGKTYIEAFRGRPYELRVTNPLPFRVAAAVSVDGLNTIDARHAEAWSSRKWVLGPGETLTIPGWQVSGSAARQFFFTGERGSYGALLGKTENLGVIEAVFFRERPAPVPVPLTSAPGPRPTGSLEAQGDASGSPIPPGLAKENRRDALSDEYAATGMGARREHEVIDVYLELDRHPIGRSTLRYEFRPQLVALGVLPRRENPRDRRERARGFTGYCPEPER